VDIHNPAHQTIKQAGDKPNPNQKGGLAASIDMTSNKPAIKAINVGLSSNALKHQSNMRAGEKSGAIISKITTNTTQGAKMSSLAGTKSGNQGVAAPKQGTSQGTADKQTPASCAPGRQGKPQGANPHQGVAPLNTTSKAETPKTTTAKQSSQKLDIPK
jgi:hypothetical protein